MGFSMNKPNMNITYGGESNKQQKSNLMKDNPVAKHASAMNMYGESKSPTEFNEGLKKASADGKLDENPGFKAKVDASKLGSKSALQQQKKESMLYKKGPHKY